MLFLMDSGRVWQQQCGRDPEGRVSELIIVDKGSSRLRKETLPWAGSIGKEVSSVLEQSGSCSGVCLLCLVGKSSWPGPPEEAPLELELDWCFNSECRPSEGTW